MKTQPDLVKKLSGLRKSLESVYFSSEKNDFQLKTSVLRGNTARTYQFNEIYTPSSMVKHWLHAIFLRPGSSSLSLVHDEPSFNKIHSLALSSLNKFWLKKEENAVNKPNDKGMQFYHLAKIIDLFFKSVPRWKALPKDRRYWFYENAHVPIDKYSLIALEMHLVEYAGISTSMRFIGNDKNLYNNVQKDIRDLIAPLPPLLFDLYAWDYLRVQFQEKPNSYDLVEIKKKQ